MKNHKIFIFNAPYSSRGIILPGRRLNNTFYKPKPIFIAGSNIKSPLGLPPIRPVTIKRMKIKRTNSTNNFTNDYNEKYSCKLCKSKLDCKTERKFYKNKEVDNNYYNICSYNKCLKKDLFEKKQNQNKKLNKVIKKSNSVIVHNNLNNLKYVEKKEKNEITINEKNNESKEENKENIEIEDKEILNKEIDDIVNYLLNLNYEKYNHDMEIREALELIRSKVNKENENNKNEDNKENNDDDKNKDNNENEEEENEGDNNNEESEKDNNNDNKEENNLTNIKNEKNHELIPIEDKEEEKKKEEIEKYKLAEIISKHKMLKNVHSIKSIRKLLQRQGLDDPNLIDKSKIENQNEINE